MSDNPFEIPQPIRDMADQNMKQAHAAYEQLTNFVAQTMNSWMGAAPSSPMTSGFKDVQDRAMDFAKDNAESAFSFAAFLERTDLPRDFAHSNAVCSRPDAGLRQAYAKQVCGLLGEAFHKLNRG